MKKLASIAGILALTGAGPARSWREPALYQQPSAPVDQRVDDLVARMTLEEKITLLGGDRTGSATSRLKSIAVIGPNAAIARTGGGGSSRVTPFYSVSPLEGMRTRLGPSVQVVHAAGCGMAGDPTTLDPALLTPPGAGRSVHGLFGEYYDNPDLQGMPVAERIDQRIEMSLSRRPATEEIALLPKGIKPQNFSVRWAGALTPNRTGEYEFSANADDGVRLYLGDRLLIDGWAGMPRAGRQATIALEANRAYPIRIEYFQKTGAAMLRIGWRPADTELLREAVQAARGADVAVVSAGLSAAYESEGFDRETLTLAANQEELIRAIAAANPRTIVVLNSGAPIVMESWSVSFDLENTGPREGAEVVQVYIGGGQASVPRPVKELKAFRKVMLRPGERTRVTIALDRMAMSYYDATRHDWVVEPGTFDVLVGCSSRDVRLRGSVTVK